MKKHYSFNIFVSVLAAIFLLPILSSQVFGQEEEFKNDFIAAMESVNLDYQLQSEVWDAFFILVDFRNADENLKTIGTYPVSQRMDLWNKESLNKSFFPRPYSEKVKMLGNLVSKYGKNSDVAVVLASIYFFAGKTQEALNVMEGYLSGAKTSQLVTAADFYHKVAMFEKEIETLYSGLKKYGKNEKEAIADRLLNLINDFELKTDLRNETYREIIRSADDKEKWFERWLTDLKKIGSSEAAESLISEYQKEYPDLSVFFNRMKADIYFTSNRTEKAVRLYYDILNPAEEDGHFGEYFSALEKANQFNPIRRSLFEKWRKKTATTTDKIVLLRMYLKNDQNRQAAAILSEIKQDFASKGFLSSDVTILAQCYKLAGNYDEALRGYNELYERAKSDAEKLRFLADIESILYSQPGLYPNLQDKSLQGWFKSVTADDLPSIFGGIISLLYNKQQLNESAEGMLAAFTACSSRKALFDLAGAVNKNFPSSGLAAKLMLDKAEICQDYGLWSKSVADLQDFIITFRDSPFRYTAYDLLIKAYDVLKQYDKEKQAYLDVLNFAETKKETGKYKQYFEGLINWLVSKKKMTDAVQIYWDEVRRHPENAAIYDDFLNFVMSNNIAPEEIKIYKYALERFQDAKWTHALARWYIRQKQWKEYEEFSRKIVSTFKNSDIQQYLLEFESYVPGYSDSNFKKQLYLQLYKYSLDRFPFNSVYLNGLLQYYRYHKEWDDYYRLAKRYFFINDNLRKIVLSEFYQQNKAISPLTISMLSQRIISGLQAGSPASAMPTDSSQGIAGVMEDCMIAFHLSWFSYYEEAVEYWARLTAVYPEESSVVEFLASLHRSLKHTEQAVSYYKRLADNYPTNTKYLTLAGEVLADVYQIELAVTYWNKIFELNPRNSDIAKEVATIFWDYYQFDKSEAVILKIRKNLGNETLFGTELAAVYESAKKNEKAVAEYIRSIASSDGSWWQEIDRLVTLSSRGSLGKIIRTGFSDALNNQPNNYNLVRACAQFYESTTDFDSLAAVYAGLINRTEDFGILSDIYYFFEERNNKENLARIWMRKVDIAEDDEWLLQDTISYFEDIGDLAKADSLIARQIAKAQAEADEFPDAYISALDNSYNYFERHSNKIKQADMLTKLIDFTSGDQKHNFQVKLARFYISEDKLDQAGSILQSLVENYPDRADYFNALAEIYTKKNDFSGLVDFYTDGLVRIKKASMHPVKKQALLDDLRRGLIGGYEKLGRYPEAVDQYIEIINKNPKDENILRDAFDFALKYKQDGKLTSYYEKTSKESFKDFRWQLILARLYSWSEKYDSAVEKFKAAIQNEPQMTELYYSLADIYVKLNKYQDAADIYSRLYRISKGDKDVLLLQAEMMMRAGKKREAMDIVKLATKENPADYTIYFKTAGKLESWGEYAAALAEIQRGTAKFKDKSSETYLMRENAELIAQVYFKNGKSVEGVFGLLDLLVWLEAKHEEMNKNGNYDAAYILNDSIYAVTAAINDKLGDFCRNYMSDADVAVLNRRMVDLFKKSKNQRRDLFLNFAMKAGLFELEEAVMTDPSYWDMNSKINYYADRRNYGKLTKFLDTLTKTAAIGSGYHVCLSKLYRIIGDTKSELNTIDFYIKNYRQYSPDWYFTNAEYSVDRFLDLSFQNKDVQVATLYKAQLVNYSGALLNFLLKNSMNDQALSLLDANPLKKPYYWTAAKKAEILFKIKRFDQKLAADLSKMLNINPVKMLVGKEQPKELTSDLWFRLAFIYAKYINRSPKPETAELYLSAPVEELPKAADKQILLADIYSELGKYPQAIDHCRLALQLQPKNNLAIRNLGEAQLKSGKKDAALATWAEILKPNLLSDYELYMSILIENGFAEKGISAFIKRISEAIEKKEYKDEILGYLDRAKDKAEESKVGMNVPDLVKKLYISRENDFQLLNSIIESGTLLTDREKTFYYEKVLVLLSSSPQTTVAALKEWNQKYYYHLTALSRFKDALALLEKLALADKEFSDLWIPSEIIRMRSKLKMDPILNDWNRKYIEDKGSYAYDEFIKVLKAEKLEKLRNQLRLEQLSKEINVHKNFSDSSLAAFAEELFIAGKTKDAEAIIKRLLTYRTDNIEGMNLAANVLEKYGYFDKAMDVRKNIAKAARDNYDNLLGMLRVHTALKQYKEALDIAQKLLLSSFTGRDIRSRTADFIIEKIQAGDPLLSPAGALFNQLMMKQGNTLDENIFMINAAIALKNGNQLKAKELLVKARRLLVNTSRAGLMLAEIFDKEGSFDKAIEEYKLVFNRMPLEKKILARLFALYYKKGDYLRAVKITEDYNYFPAPDDPPGNEPILFVPIQDSLVSDKDKIELLNNMEAAALKINSLSRAIYYHNLLQPLVSNDETLYRKWKETEVQYKKQYDELVRKEKEALSIRWEL